MRRNRTQSYSLVSMIPALALLWGPLYAQGPFHGGSHSSWPVGLQMMTATGTVIVDSSHTHPVYFLDEGGDDIADYHLAFGPWWYEPPSGATRPAAGDTVTVVGALRGKMDQPTLVVFELDGLIWRESIEYGHRGWNGGSFWIQGRDTVTVTGVALVDTTYFYHHYYLDSDGDAFPDFVLGFGPGWYEPANGAARPDNGETVTVSGLLLDRPGLDLLSVHQIDGQTWRPLEGPAPWAGQWVRRNHAGPSFVFCVNDTTNWIRFPPGHMGRGQGMGWADSTFVQFWQIHPDSLPGPIHSDPFMGFFLNVHDPSGQSMMNGQFGGNHGRMRFESEHRVRFHYYEEYLQTNGISEGDFKVQLWDEAAQRWTDVSGVRVDADANTVTFSTNELSSHYALVAADMATDVEGSESDNVPSDVALYQNFPNPFGVLTTIEYGLASRQRVALTVYDLLGRPVRKLVEAEQSAGLHKVSFDSWGLPNGVYLYQMQAGQISRTRHLTVVRP